MLRLRRCSLEEFSRLQNFRHLDRIVKTAKRGNEQILCRLMAPRVVTKLRQG